MKMMRVFAALIVGAAMVLAPALMAQDAPAPAPAPAPKEEKPADKPKEPEKAPEGDKDKPKEGEKKEEESAFAVMFKGLSDITGKSEFTETDVKAFIKDYPELDKITEADKKFKEIADKSLKEAFEYLVKNEKYTEWAKAKGVDADKYLRVTLRIMTTQIKLAMKEYFKAGDEELAAGRKKLEAMKDELSEDSYKERLAELDAAKKEFEGMKKTIDGVPGPTEAEAKLFEANKAEIAKAMGQGEDSTDDADDEKEDGMGGK